jgi:hypothetical protein
VLWLRVAPLVVAGLVFSFWIPTALILGTTAALIATDPYSAPHFQHTATFSGFNNVFSGTATTAGILIAPAALYVGGWPRRIPK